MSSRGRRQSKSEWKRKKRERAELGEQKQAAVERAQTAIEMAAVVHDTGVALDSKAADSIEHAAMHDTRFTIWTTRLLEMVKTTLEENEGEITKDECKLIVRIALAAPEPPTNLESRQAHDWIESVGKLADAEVIRVRILNANQTLT